MAPWTLFSKVLGAKDAEGEITARAIPRTAEAGHAFASRGPLDEVGQQSEQVRERINSLTLRLDELKSLADDFGQIVQPINDVVTQHVHIQSRLMEAEALLSREREVSAATRSELNDLHANSSRTFGELAAATAELRGNQGRLHDQDAMITQLRLRVDDQSVTIDSIERQIVAETERARALSDDNQTLRAEVESAEQARSRAENDLADAREQIAIAHAENSRLQQLAESLSHRMSGLKGQIMELEPQIQSSRQELAMMQTKLSTEQLGRQKAEVTRESERVAHETEIASLTMKIEGLNAHVGTTERIVANLRDQFRDKAEALRIAEKSLKDALADRAASERRMEVAQEAATRHLAQVGDAQRTHGELKDRAEMLAKALAAKEAQLDSGSRKIANLTSRIDQINARFEQERASFEAANRRLIEELQSEKAERSLAQGALDIARNSRAKLLTQYTALKRQQSPGSSRPLDLGPEDEIHPRSEPGGDNVRVFKSNDNAD